jgi:uncharacterized protein
MTWKAIHLNDVPPAPWRNGGGTTRELVAWPDSAAWQWRASVAEVIQDGPFSSFAGVKRWFAVLQGDGVCLTVDGHLHMLTKSDQPLAFDGEAQTTCELLGGATQDFNLMLQGDASARVQRVSNNVSMTIITPKIIAAYAYKTGAKVRIDTEHHELLPNSFGWMWVDPGTAIHIQTSDALLMEIDV